MELDEVEIEMKRCRKLTFDWLEKMGFPCTEDVEAVRAIVSWANRTYGLTIESNWNPSACVFEVRWKEGQRAADGFERPYVAETKDRAQLSACAGLLTLIESLSQHV